MGKKHGARSKTTTQNIQKQAPETGAKSKNVQSKNMNYDGFRNPTKSSSVEKRDSWDIPENTKRPSKYTSDEIWGSLPSNSSECENAWGKGDSNKNKGAHTNRGNRTVPLVGASFSWEDNEDFLHCKTTYPL